MWAALWDKDCRPRPETDYPYQRATATPLKSAPVHAQPKVDEFVLIRCLMASLNHFAN